MEIEGAAPNMTGGEGLPSGGNVLPQNTPAAAASALIPIVGPTTIVPEVLTESNYEYWSTCVKSYLMAQDLWEICTTKPEEITDPERKKKNAVALHAIQISCSRRMLPRIMEFQFASEAWDALESFAYPNLPGDRQVSTGNRTDLSQYEKLRKDLERGDWNNIELFLQSKPEAVRARISVEGMTPLHIAARAGNVEVVEKLMGKLNEEDLEITDSQSFTPLAVAALSGITGTAQHMITKHKKLASNISVGNRILPVVFACGQGEEEMTRFLYSHTDSDTLSPDGGKNGATLLRFCIACKFLDIALDVLKKHPRLAFEEDLDGITPLYTLGQMTALFKKRSQLWFWQRWIYSCITISIDDDIDRVQVHVDHATQSNDSRNSTKKGIDKIRDQKLRYYQAKRMLKCVCNELQNINLDGPLGDRVHQAVIKAIKQGNIKFVKKIIKSIPELMWKFDNDGRNIFSIATVYRQEKVFDLLQKLPNKRKLTFDIDKFNNNTLHLAAMLAPRDQLDGISGAALQMQRELHWFKEVKSIGPPSWKAFVNSDGKTPGEVFSDQHASLVKEGEKWMKDIATSSSFVAALVVTIVFAAAFTIPGGNNDKGIPTLLKDKLLMVFMVSDSISLFFATTSVFTFLGILTSEYAEKKFRTWLPMKLIIGLSSLFISIVAMMVAFCAALAISVKESSSKVVIIPIIVLACIPVTAFVILQSPLLARICISTYKPRIFSKKIPRRR